MVDADGYFEFSCMERQTKFGGIVMEKNKKVEPGKLTDQDLEKVTGGGSRPHFLGPFCPVCGQDLAYKERTPDGLCLDCDAARGSK